MSKILGPTHLIYIAYQLTQYRVERLRDFEYAIEVEQPDGRVDIEVWQDYRDASRLDIMCRISGGLHEKVLVFQDSRIVEDEKDMDQARRRRIQLQHVLEVQES